MTIMAASRRPAPAWGHGKYENMQLPNFAAYLQWIEMKIRNNLHSLKHTLYTSTYIFTSSVGSQKFILMSFSLEHNDA